MADAVMDSEVTDVPDDRTAATLELLFAYAEAGVEPPEGEEFDAAVDELMATDSDLIDLDAEGDE